MDSSKYTREKPIYPGAVATGDFNGDGLLDLVIAENWETPRVLLRTNDSGTPKFTKQTDSREEGLTEWPYSRAVATGDLNGDGNIDLVFAVDDSSDSHHSHLAINNKNSLGTFTRKKFRWTTVDDCPPPSAEVVDTESPSWDSRSVAIGDLDGDGRNDIYLGLSGQDKILINKTTDASNPCFKIFTVGDSTDSTFLTRSVVIGEF